MLGDEPSIFDGWRPNRAAATPCKSGSDDDAELAKAAALPPLEYERRRKEIADRLGISRLTTLDKLVAAARKEDASEDTAGKRRRLAIVDPDPWPDPVDGAALIETLASTIRRYVVLESSAAVAAALWAVHTSAIEAAYVSPRLAITSPERRCGKTTLLTLLGALVARPLTATNMTVATMFRAIEAARPTLLVDEADTFLSGAEELRGVINAGHSRGAATVLRTVETRDGYEVRSFGVWGAMALAAIGKLPGTIEDRSIKIALRRRRPDEGIDRLRIDRLAEFMPQSRRVARWVADNLDQLRAADSVVPAELHDRAADNWRPLLAIADAAGGVWPERAREAAKVLTLETAEDSETARIMLLADMRALFAARQTDRLTSEEAVAYLVGLDDRPWPEYRGGKPITKTQLARLLKPFGVSCGSIRLDDGRTPKGYHLAAFADAFARYLPAAPLSKRHNATTKAQPGVFADSEAPQGALTGPLVAFRNAENRSVSAACGVVAFQNPGDDDFAERAAILEFDAGYSRPEAERLAGLAK